MSANALYAAIRRFTNSIVMADFRKVRLVGYEVVRNLRGCVQHVRCQ